jgi:large subunit ribosomal protein L1
MKELAPVAKVLGPKGLMPSPKAGTVTADVATAVSEVKKGRLEFKLDKTGNIHSKIGKISFDDSQLIENFNTLLKAIEENKPSGVKGKLIKKIVIAPTMGAGAAITY